MKFIALLGLQQIQAANQFCSQTPPTIVVFTFCSSLHVLALFLDLHCHSNQILRSTAIVYPAFLTSSDALSASEWISIRRHSQSRWMHNILSGSLACSSMRSQRQLCWKASTNIIYGRLQLDVVLTKSSRIEPIQKTEEASRMRVCNLRWRPSFRSWWFFLCDFALYIGHYSVYMPSLGTRALWAGALPWLDAWSIPHSAQRELHIFRNIQHCPMHLPKAWETARAPEKMMKSFIVFSSWFGKSRIIAK